MGQRTTGLRWLARVLHKRRRKTKSSETKPKKDSKKPKTKHKKLKIPRSLPQKSPSPPQSCPPPIPPSPSHSSQSCPLPTPNHQSNREKEEDKICNPNPEPVVKYPNPEHMGELPNPEHMGEYPNPEPVGKVPNPEPVVKDPNPEPVVKDPNPEPVGKYPNPEPVGKYPNPEPVGDEDSPMRRAFKRFDSDGDGKVSPSELGILMRSVGGNPTQAQLKYIISKEKLKSSFDYNRFEELMEKHMKPAEEFDGQLRDAFRLMDKEGTGFVSVSSLRHVLINIGEKLEASEFDEWVRDIDVGSDGKMRYEDFIARLVAQ